jgi:hypothetical protein
MQEWQKSSAEYFIASPEIISGWLTYVVRFMAAGIKLVG